MVRILDVDGTLHFSHLKKIALSGVQYLHAVNNEIEPTRDMKVGTILHFILLGARHGAKPLVLYKETKTRSGKKWEEFEAAHAGSEIVTQAEWDDAEHMAESVRRSPIAQRRFENARFEVPLTWEESGIKCSTSGVDIIPLCEDLGDLKSSSTTNPEAFKRQCFNMSYPQQLAFYRRGAIANGLKVKNLFILGVERKAPFEVVELALTPELVAFADKSLDLWFEELRRNMLSIPEPETVYDWPGYAQAPVQWDVPPWMTPGEVNDDGASEEDVAA